MQEGQETPSQSPGCSTEPGLATTLAHLPPAPCRALRGWHPSPGQKLLQVRALLEVRGDVGPGPGVWDGGSGWEVAKPRLTRRTVQAGEGPAHV